MEEAGAPYCRGRLKRSVDLVASVSGLVLLSPLLGLLALLTLVLTGPPIFFTQERVGLSGRLFRILKFRTMRDVTGGLLVTGRDDARITRWGKLLRDTKLDELPQLINVIRGEMSIVGPRPEVPRYVEAYTPEQRRVLDARPGLTDPATIEFREEEDLLAANDPSMRERYYVEEILPKKIALNLEYLRQASLVYDLGLIARTLRIILVLER